MTQDSLGRWGALNDAEWLGWGAPYIVGYGVAMYTVRSSMPGRKGWYSKSWPLIQVPAPVMWLSETFVSQQGSPIVILTSGP